MPGEALAPRSDPAVGVAAGTGGSGMVIPVVGEELKGAQADRGTRPIDPELDERISGVGGVPVGGVGETREDGVPGASVEFLNPVQYVVSLFRMAASGPAGGPAP